MKTEAKAKDDAKTKDDDVILSTNLFSVVGIGASAGGLEAFKQLISAIPVDSGMAFILVQHLDPDHNSVLPDLLQKITLIPVHEIKDNVHVEPNNIYVIPPNKILTANNGILNLEPRIERHRSVSVDVFFASLAEIHQNQAIGVVLSGTGKDGTEGLKAIKAHGGITFAQLQGTAAFDGMPQNAIDEGVVDFVLPPNEIISHLLELSSHARDTVDPLTSEKNSKPNEEGTSFGQIISLINKQKGIDFTYYKQTTIRRRIARRMVLLRLRKMEDYVARLNDSSKEVDALFQDMLILVTDFFRDPKVFEHLSDTALPAIIKNKSHGDSIRLWVVGCSTGQETYSLGMLLFEFLEHLPGRYNIQIFSTDLSELAVAKARAGRYSLAETASVSETRLAKFFSKSEGGYQVNKLIRDMCVFSHHNVLTDAPFSNIDFVSCRNVLIYMDAFLQRKAMATFHYALKPNGILFLGQSESTSNSADLFGSFTESDKLYTRKLVPVRFTRIVPKRSQEVLSGRKDKKEEFQHSNDDFQRNADDVILSLSPNGVIVNEQLEIVQFRGVTGDWLEPASGKPSLNILKMAKRGLVLELRSLINQVKLSSKPANEKGILSKGKGWTNHVTIDVFPLLNTINPYFLILFNNTQEVPDKKAGKAIKGKKEKLTPHELRAKQLEGELSQTREDMRSYAEDQEVGNEELLSANEELTSHSEELRSLNEELEISKEELQSSVEELSASNQQLADRNDELKQSHSYTEGILSTIREPLIVLDANLRVKSANASFYKTFKYTEEETEGQFFYELGNDQWNAPELKTILDKTLKENRFYESYEVKRNFSSIGERTMLLNARKIQNTNSSDTLLLAIEDITDRRKLEHELKAAADSVKTILDASLQLTSVGNVDGTVNYYSKSYLDYTGLSLEEALTSGNWDSIIHPDMLEAVNRARDSAISKGEIFYVEMLLRRHDGEYRWHGARALPIRNSDGTIISWVGVASDIHDQKLFAKELERKVNVRTELLRESNQKLANSNENLEQFAFIASHDLQEPLRKIKTFSSMLTSTHSDGLSDEGKRLVEKIFTSSDRMSTLIKDILNFSRIENTQSIFIETDLNKILDDVLIDLHLLMTEKKSTTSREPLPTLIAVPFQMNQLFQNLLGNSLKFARKDVASAIEISSRRLTKIEAGANPDLNSELTYCEIVVKDNGIGFDQKYAEKIFTIFQRLHSSQFSGNGIGLALCKRIVVNHHGHIKVKSVEHEGTAFHIILPYTQLVRSKPEMSVEKQLITQS